MNSPSRTLFFLATLAGLATAAGAQTVTVTTCSSVVDVDFFEATIDDLPGPDGLVSLREAMIATNNVPGHQTIEFAIPESEWYLPDIYPGLVLIQSSTNWSAMEPVTIDGTTQTAFTGDTNPDGWEIVLYGLTLVLNGDGSVVKGLHGSPVTAFGSGNDIHDNTGDMYIQLYNGSGSLIHDNEAGTIKLQQSHDNVIVRNTMQRLRIWGAAGPAVNNRVGGPDPADRNFITGWGNYGEHGVPGGTTVELSDTRDTLVENNWIGVTPDGMQIGNDASTVGIWIMNETRDLVVRNNLIAARAVGVGPALGALYGQPMFIETYGGGSGIEITGNTMGLNAAGEPLLGGVHGIWVSRLTIEDAQDVLVADNVIAGHASTGVLMMHGPGEVAQAGIRLAGNSIHANGEIDIDLMPDTWTFGPTANDALDADEGANGLQNFPEISSATRRGAVLRIAGKLNSEPLTEFTVEFFASPACAAVGYGPGEVFLGSRTVETDAAGQGAFDVLLPARTPLGWVVTSTATREPIGATSEFSACTRIQPVPDWRERPRQSYP